MRSNRDKKRKYFFEEFGFSAENVAGGKVFPNTAGRVVKTLDINRSPDDYINSAELVEIVKDCCPVEISGKGDVKACFDYFRQCEADLSKYQELHVHVIDED